MFIIDELAYCSRWREKNACLKSFFAISTLLFIVLFSSFWYCFFLFIFISSLVIYAGRLSLIQYIKLMIIPGAFILLSVIAMIVHTSKIPLWISIIQINGYFIGIHKASFLLGIQLAIKAFAAVSCLYFLSCTTPITDLIYVLEKLHCPDILIELMLLIYRFVFLFSTIAISITTSQKSRLGNRNLKTSYSCMGKMLSVLLILSLKKSEKLYDAMESRCYNGKIRVLREKRTIKKREFYFVIGVQLIILALGIWLKY